MNTATNEIDDRTLDALNARRDALRAYEDARSAYMSFVVSPFIYDGDPRMAEARLTAVNAWLAYEQTDMSVARVTGEGGDGRTHRP